LPLMATRRAAIVDHDPGAWDRRHSKREASRAGTRSAGAGDDHGVTVGLARWPPLYPSEQPHLAGDSLEMAAWAFPAAPMLVGWTHSRLCAFSFPSAAMRDECRGLLALEVWRHSPARSLIPNPGNASCLAHPALQSRRLDGAGALGGRIPPLRRGQAVGVRSAAVGVRGAVGPAHSPSMAIASSSLWNAENLVRLHPLAMKQVSDAPATGQDTHADPSAGHRLHFP
jgi:hypothetical protein